MKLSKILVGLSCFSLLISCKPYAATFNDDVFIEEQIKDITHLMKENKAEELYDYFSVNTKNETPTLREDVSKLCEYYTGGEFVKWFSGGNSVGTNEQFDHGKTVKSLISRSKFKAETKNYFIQMSWTTKDSYDNNNVGIKFLYITEFNDGEEPVTTFSRNGEVILINEQNGKE